MILSNREIVWTPNIGVGSLGIALDKTFAEACLAHQLEDMPAFTDAVWKYMDVSSQLKSLSSRTFTMEGSSLLMTGIYPGHDGVWLTLNKPEMSDATKPFMYAGHNEEQVRDRYWLLLAFQAWVAGAMIVLNWK